MDKQSVRSTFMEMSNAGAFAPIQLLPISHILDAVCPDSICKIDKSVVLSYSPENVHVSVSTFNVVIRDLFNDKCKKWDIDDYPTYIPQLKKILSERGQSLQTKTIRAVTNCFGDVVSKWSGVIWSNHVPVDKLELLVMISPSSVDVDLFRSGETNSVLHKSMLIENPQAVVDNIIFWCKSVDKNFVPLTTSISEIAVAPAHTDSIRITSFFSSSSDIQMQLESDGLCQEDAELAATTIERLRKPQSADECIPVSEVCRILNNLASEVNDSCFGSFADGWKEALSAAINRISAVHSSR